MMPDLTLYRLEPATGRGFHFGRQGLELEASLVTFPSDSLFSALVATVAEDEGEMAAYYFAAPFLDDDLFSDLVDHVREKRGDADADAVAEAFPTRTLPFRFTSVFPRAGRLPLLPRPEIEIRPGNARVSPKIYKELQFVSPQIWDRLRRGRVMEAYLPPDGAGAVAEQGRFLQDGAIWLTADEQALLPREWRKQGAAALRARKVWDQGAVTRVTLDRASSASEIYQMGRVAFHEECGLWLGVRYHDEGWVERLEGLLRHLGDRGIGGERSQGYGAFTLPDDDGLALANDDGLEEGGEDGHHILLSRWLPQEGEVDALRGERVAYQLVTVGGWLYTPGRAQALRRKQVTMLAEGGVVGRDVAGRVVDVKPDIDPSQGSLEPVPHPVYRYGVALTAPVAIGSVDDE